MGQHDAHDRLLDLPGHIRHLALHGRRSGNPYNDYYFAYSSSAFPELGDHSGVNDTRFSSPAMDAALATLKTAVDPATVLPAAQAVQDA